MIYPSINNSEERKTRCLRNSIGSCGGCNIALIAMGLVRWHGLSIEAAEEKIRHNYCPTGEYPNIEPEVNRDASCTMGAPRQENLEGLTLIPRLGWMARR